MQQKNRLKPSAWLVFILTAGVFGIINTEMGVIGILPLIAETFHVTVPQAGWTVSVFALVVAASAPVMPLLFSGFNRKQVMLLAMGLFTLSNIISMLTTNFTVLLIARALPAFLHPVYVSMALTVAASTGDKAQGQKNVARVFVGVSAGMVLGVPVTSYLASAISFEAGMLFFTVINVLVLLATAVFVPSMPVREKLSYGAQLSVLKKKITWYSIAAITLINGALFGFFSYMSDFLQRVTGLTYGVISTLLLVYGLANIIGNMIAGRQLVQNSVRSMAMVPLTLLGFYAALFFMGEWVVAMALIILMLGILAGYAQNTNQYMITHAAPEAPDFANALFLLSANLGTMMGAAVCGAFITVLDTRYSVLGALLFLMAGIVFVMFRIRAEVSEKQLKKTSITVPDAAHAICTVSLVSITIKNKEHMKRISFLAVTTLFTALGTNTAFAQTDADNFYRSTAVNMEKITFPNQYKMQVAGNLFLPKDLKEGERRPAIIVGHPMGAVKEQSANLYATRMAERGFVTLSIDLSFWGESEGEPRNAVLPELYAEAFSAAVDFLGLHPFVSREQIGAIGICGSGSFAISAAKIDPRLKAVATISMYDMGTASRSGLKQAQTLEQRKQIIAEAARQRWVETEGGETKYTGGTVHQLTDRSNAIEREFFEFYRTPRGEFTPESANPQTTTHPTLSSNVKFMNFYPFNDIETISPRALLFIAGDHAHSREFSEDAYRLAAEPKELFIVPNSGHVDLYDRVGLIPFDKMESFFREYLKSADPDKPIQPEEPGDENVPGNPPGDNNNHSNHGSDTPMSKQLKITVGSVYFKVTLEDNATATAFRAVLPMTVNMSELNGNEKYTNLSAALGTGSAWVTICEL